MADQYVEEGQGREPAPDLSDVAAAPSAARRACILAVDDDMLIAMSTSELLDDLGYDVIEANSGEQALEVLRENGNVDLLLTDYSMPKMNGLELAQAALALRPGLPILIATGYAELPADAALDLPCLGKPYQQAQLSDAIGRLLAR